MEKLEAIATSPYFAILLAAVGSWLFVLLTREFATWFFKLGHFENELQKIQTKLEEISQNIKTAPTPSAPTIASSLPPIPNGSIGELIETPRSITSMKLERTETKKQFPIQH